MFFGIHTISNLTSTRKLLGAPTVGGFLQPIYDVFTQDKALLIAVAQQLLDAHFPSPLHHHILEAVGVEVR